MFKGSMVALITPFTAEGEVDYAAFQQLVDWHAEDNVLYLSEKILRDKRFGGSEPLVEIDRADNRLECISEDHIARTTSVFRFALREQ